MFDTQKIADAYDQIALNFSVTRTKLSAEVISLLPPLKPTDHVLDLGCGNGVFLTSLPKTINYLGLDISKALLDEAKKAHPGKDFILADVTKPESWNALGTFDFIAALALAHHLPTEVDLDFVITKALLHLKPGGHLLVTVWRLDQPKFDKYLKGDHLSIPFHGGPNRDFRLVTEGMLATLFDSKKLKVAKTAHTKDNYNYLLTK